MTSDERHRWGRTILENAWQGVVGAPPSLGALQIAGAVAELETNYGRGWKGPGAGSNNWGAIICTKQPIAGEAGCPAGCFPNLDSSPGKPAEMRCFRAYATPEEGAAHLIKLITVNRPGSLAAMSVGDIDAFSRDMHRTHYYEGTSLDPEVNIDRHASKVAAGVAAIAKALGEPQAAQRGGPTGGGSSSGDDTFGTIATVCLAGVLGYVMYRVSRG